MQLSCQRPEEQKIVFLSSSIFTHNYEEQRVNFLRTRDLLYCLLDGNWLRNKKVTAYGQMIFV